VPPNQEAKGASPFEEATMRNDFKWRCRRCGHLLGIEDGSRLHIQFARGHQYWCALPVSCVCRKCGTLNELGHVPGGNPPGHVSPQQR